MRHLLTTAALAAILAAPVSAEIRPDQAAFRDLYKELVETNTTLSAGSCTLAAERMAGRLNVQSVGDAGSGKPAGHTRWIKHRCLATAGCFRKRTLVSTRLWP